MNKPEKIAELRYRKFEIHPKNPPKEIGYFNIFRLGSHVEDNPVKLPPGSHHLYKIILIQGNSKVYYADQVVEIQKQGLSFVNSQTFNKWEDHAQEKICCIFDKLFFHQFGNIQQYEVFKPGRPCSFELSDEQFIQVSEIYKRIMDEFASNYRYKFELIRNLIFELLHFAIKLGISSQALKKPQDASQRIAMLFRKLLEHQFPIDDPYTQIHFRSPSDSAQQLNVHVNHLNRVVKQTTGKTTSQIIAGRILREAKILLKHSAWSVSEIAYALGFTEATHFNNFFKKHVQLSPTKFREVRIS